MRKVAFQRPSKKAIILSCVGLVVLLVAGYTTFSLLSWQRHQQAVETQADRWGGQIDAIIALDSVEYEEVSQRVTEYRQQVKNTSCEPSVLIAWQQQFVSSWKSSVARCQIDALHYGGLSDKLDRVARYLRGQSEVVTLLDAAGRLAETQGADTWQASYDTWQEIVSKLDAIDSTDDIEPLVEATKTAASGVVDAWGQLLEAHEGEDAEAFSQAREELNMAYEGLAELEVVNQRQLDRLIDDFASSYDRIVAEMV